jgi:trehalose synthase
MNPKLPVDQSLIYPAIDPLSTKNREMEEDECMNHIERMDIPMDKPIISQISRFDKWKDPIGVIDVFKKVRKKEDCRLVLCGSMASDDPEGYKIYDDVKEAAGDLIDKGEILIRANETDLAINALQRSSKVVVQKSIREGFGLTVTEALWKETPVVCSNAGGLSIQVEDGHNGYVLDAGDNQGFAERIIHIMRNGEKFQEMKKNARESVRKRFLVTRIMLDYMNLFNSYENGGVV